MQRGCWKNDNNQAAHKAMGHLFHQLRDEGSFFSGKSRTVASHKVIEEVWHMLGLW